MKTKLHSPLGWSALLALFILLPSVPHAIAAAEAENWMARGLKYSSGQGVEKDPVEAVRWFRKAAEAGSTAGMYELGMCLRSGIGVAADAEEASLWFKRGAGQRNDDCSNAYARGLIFGWGVTKNVSEGLQQLLQTAAKGHIYSCDNLAGFYREGRVTDRDMAKSDHWAKQGFGFKKQAAEKGDIESMNSLGYAYRFGIAVLKDAAEAGRWYRKAADLGHSTAQFNLGSCYLTGVGVEKNPEESTKWFRKAADQGNERAQNEMGMASLLGRGTDMNEEQANYWFKKAAAAGHVAAMANLGRSYAIGRGGVAQDQQQAVAWMQKAAKFENPDAVKWLKENAETTPAKTPAKGISPNK